MVAKIFTPLFIIRSFTIILGGCSPKFVKCHPPISHNTGKRKPNQNAQKAGVKSVKKAG